MNKSKLIAICGAVVVAFIIILAVMFASGSFKTDSADITDSVKYVIKFDRSGRPIGSGTAFVTNGRGILITNAHVAGTEKSDGVYVMPDADELLYVVYVKQLKHRKIVVMQRAIVESVNSGQDLAKLRVVSPDRTSFFPIAFSEGGTSGEKVTALGYPNAYNAENNRTELYKTMYRFLSPQALRQMPERLELEWNDSIAGLLNIVTKPGSINQIRQSTLGANQAACELVVHDATLAAGMSGGPLVNAKGQLVGINSRARVLTNTDNPAFQTRMEYAVSVKELKHFLNEEDYIEGSVNPIVYKARVFLQHASAPTIVLTIISIIMVIGAVVVLIRLLTANNSIPMAPEPQDSWMPDEDDGPTIPVGAGAKSGGSNGASIVLTGVGPNNTPLRFRIPQSELLSQNSIIIGRGKTCRILLPFNTVSRQHAALSYRQDQKGNGYIYLNDLKASNKTLVNGKAITSRSLVPGDTITLASVKLRLSVENN